MAIFYVRTSIVRASSGKSAVASAAYQAAESLRDEKLNRRFSYSHKEEVVHSEVLLPDFAPREYADRETLWNAVEKKENKSNSRFARQFVIATPREWTQEETIARSRDFIQSALVDKGMIADWSLHRKDGNPHLHIMATVRGFQEDGSWATMERKQIALDENGERIPEIDPATGQQKLRERERNGSVSVERLWKRITVQTNNWNQRAFLQEVKRAWAEECNRHLEPGQPLDWRSYKEQGVNRVAYIHEGPQAIAALRCGEKLDAVEKNEQRRQINIMLARLERFLRDARNLLVELQNKWKYWREIHGKRRSIAADRLVGRDEGTSASISESDPGNDCRIGPGRPAQEIKADLRNLNQKAERLHRHKHRH